MLDGLYDLCWSWWCYKVNKQLSIIIFRFSQSALSSSNHFNSRYSTRVSNELGAGNSQGARLALRVMIIIAITEGATVGVTTVLVRHVWGRLYSNETEVINYVAKMMPLLALSDFLDGFQCVLSGPS